MIRKKLQNALEKFKEGPAPRGNKRRTPVTIVIMIAALIGFVQLSTSLFAPDPEQDAWGKIILPPPGAQTGPPLIIVGETQDIPSGQHIWLVAEAEDSQMCYPKKRVLRNTRFRAEIQENNLIPPYSISIFVIDEILHQQWETWTASKSSPGIPIPNENRRLDTVRITL